MRAHFVQQAAGFGEAELLQMDGRTLEGRRAGLSEHVAHHAQAGSGHGRAEGELERSRSTALCSSGMD
jgi:hypothetical protein